MGGDDIVRADDTVSADDIVQAIYSISSSPRTVRRRRLSLHAENFAI